MRCIILALASGAVLFAGAVTYEETLATPAGLEIRVASMHTPVPGRRDADGSASSDRAFSGYFSCSHGNPTVRIRVDNPTMLPQSLTVEFPVTVGGLHCLFGRARVMKCAVTRVIPVGKGKIVDFALPHVGMMRMLCDNDQWLFTDATGKTVSGSRLLLPWATPQLMMPNVASRGKGSSERMPSCVPNDRDYVLAVSPSFRGASKLVKRLAAESTSGKSNCGSGADIDVNGPDFACFGDWRDFACYDAVVFTTNDWLSCSDAVRACAKDYEAAGGRVIFAEDESEIDVPGFRSGLKVAKRALSGYGGDSPYSSDREGMAAVDGHCNRTPFGSIVLVLFAFVLLAGPVAIFALARRGRRIHILWVFPTVAIVFSVAVALTIVFSNGLDVKVETFTCEVERPELGRKVVVKNRVLVAPFPMKDPIRCSSSALVTVDSGTDAMAGDRVVSLPDALLLVGNWTPCLWPVRVRELEVIRTGNGGEK